MSGRLIKVGGVTAAAAMGYYLYQAGGSPKVAEKQFEHDAAKLSSKVRGEMPGAAKEAKTGVNLTAQEAGQKLDNAMDQARKTTGDIDQKLEEYRKTAGQKYNEYTKEAGKDINKAIDTFDRKVEEGASKAKSSVSGWFGSK